MPDARYTGSCLLFALKNIISRGYRGYSTFFGISRVEGGLPCPRLNGKSEGVGGVLYEIPSVVGVWIFSGTTQ